MRLSYLRVLTALVSAASIAGTVTAPVFASERVVGTTDNYTHTCGPITCSIYYTKEHIKRIRDTLNRFAASNATNLGAATTACGAVTALLPPLPLVCGAIGGGIGVYIANLTTYAGKAANRNRCMKLRTPKGTPGTPPWFSPDNSNFCR